MNIHRGSDALEHLESILPPTFENRILERQELFRLDLSTELKRLRKYLGLTQKQVAEKLGVTQSWISKLESANHDHTFSEIIAYLAALDADFEFPIFLNNEQHTCVSASKDR
jgi:DNA-binding XRE family transcriptional regulator